MLEAIIEDLDNSREIEKIYKYFASLIKPKEFYGNDSAELKYELEFERNCIRLSIHTNKEIKKMSTKEYFSLIDYHNRLTVKEFSRDGRRSNKTR